MSGTQPAAEPQNLASVLATPAKSSPFSALAKVAKKPYAVLGAVAAVAVVLYALRRRHKKSGMMTAPGEDQAQEIIDSLQT